MSFGIKLPFFRSVHYEASLLIGSIIFKYFNKILHFYKSMRKSQFDLDAWNIWILIIFSI